MKLFIDMNNKKIANFSLVKLKQLMQNDSGVWDFSHQFSHRHYAISPEKCIFSLEKNTEGDSAPTFDFIEGNGLIIHDKESHYEIEVIGDAFNNLYKKCFSQPMSRKKIDTEKTDEQVVTPGCVV